MNWLNDSLKSLELFEKRMNLNEGWNLGQKEYVQFAEIFIQMANHEAKKLLDFSKKMDNKDEGDHEMAEKLFKRTINPILQWAKSNKSYV